MKLCVRQNILIVSGVLRAIQIMCSWRSTVNLVAARRTRSASIADKIKTKILEISRQESTNHHQLARWSTAERSKASRAHLTTMGQCLVQLCEHHFFSKIVPEKRCSVRPVLGAQCMYEDFLWSKV